MKLLLAILALAAAVGFSAIAQDAADTAKPKKKAAKKKAAASAKRLLHVVAFKFKADATPAQIKQVEDAFRALPGKISAIQAFDWGTNNSPEKLDKGFTHGFLLTFGSEADRDVYLKHPEHDAFVKIAKPLLEDVFVIDYWAKN
jgi:hypothetical protein